MPPFNHHQAVALYMKELQRRYCSHANASGQPCGGQIVKARTLQKSGGLEAIAREPDRVQRRRGQLARSISFRALPSRSRRSS